MQIANVVQKKWGIVAFLLTLMLLLTTAIAAAEVETTMRIDRAVKAGADECYRTIANVQAGDYVKLLGRNASGSWVFIWADAGDGWVPSSSVIATNAQIMTLNPWTDHFNGEACQRPRPQFDSRICGRPGNATTANTVRWTNIFSTADPNFDTGRAYTPDTALTLTGRDFWGCWVRARSNTAAGNGWVPVQALDERGVLSLPVVVDNSNGCQIVNGAVVNCDQNNDGLNIRTVNADTRIYSEPSTDTATERNVPANGRVRVVSERPGWIRITSRYGNGFIQAGTLNPADPNDAVVNVNRNTILHSEPDTDLPVGVTIPQGSTVTIVGFSTGWIRITSSFGDGWILASAVNRIAP